jgi:ABC-type branched-subunit amino acid transport system substrate-binding protein
MTSRGGAVKHYRFLPVISLLFLCLWFMGVAGKPSIAAPVSDSVNRNAVGCVFPLTGRFAEEGKKAFDAVMLSADISHDRFSSPWKIITADSGETPEAMKKAIAYLADEAKVIAIIAVSGTAEATVAAIEAQTRQVPIILIASKEGITDAGEYVFQHFLTPAQQIEALTKYALDTMNIAIFSVLYPDDDYGEEMARLFRRDVQKRGGKVKKAVLYDKTQTDFAKQIQELKEKKTGAGEKFSAAKDEDKSRWSADFEALFIPDSAFRVKMITAQLAFYNVRGVQLFGTSLWHTPDLLKNSEAYLEGAFFTDSFWADSFRPRTTDFVVDYSSAYGRRPEKIDALAYDTMKLVLGILEDPHVTSRREFMRSLLATENFQGVAGGISFGGNRVAQKEAFIFRIQDGKIEQVK